jgi:hypothetical protein
VEESDESITIHFEGVKKAHILHLHLSSIPSSIMLDNKQLSSPHDFHYDVEKSKLIIKTDMYSLGEYTIIK